MVVPGHVVFLWRIIHQHFTLAFSEHPSVNEPSCSLREVSSRLPATVLVPSRFFSLERYRSDAPPPDRGSAVSVIPPAAKSKRLCVKTAFHSCRCQELRGSASLKWSLLLRFQGVWRVFDAFLRNPDHLDLQTSLLPYPPRFCSVKLPWQEEEGAYTPHLRPTQTLSWAFQNNVTFSHPEWKGRWENTSLQAVSHILCLLKCCSSVVWSVYLITGSAGNISSGMCDLSDSVKGQLFF